MTADHLAEALDRLLKASMVSMTDQDLFTGESLSAWEDASEALDAYRSQSPAEAHGDVLVPLTLLEDASSAIGNFVSDHGWGDSDMQAMDNLDAYIARHKANVAAKVQPKGTEAQYQALQDRYWLGVKDGRAGAQARSPAPAPATGETNGRRDGLRPAVHGRVPVGGYTSGALADLLFASSDVMSLNAELDLTMDQLVQLTKAVLTAVPCAAVGADDARDAARYRWLVNNSFDKQGVTQMQCWLHTWEPHSQTGESTEWVQRIRGPALDRFIDAAMGESQPPVQGSKP